MSKYKNLLSLMFMFAVAPFIARAETVAQVHADLNSILHELVLVGKNLPPAFSAKTVKSFKPKPTNFSEDKRIDVLALMEDETWHGGETKQIAWTSANVNTVKIYLYKNEMIDRVLEPEFSYSNNYATFEYTVPFDLERDARYSLRLKDVSVADGTVYNDSRSYFRVGDANALAYVGKELANVLELIK